VHRGRRGNANVCAILTAPTQSVDIGAFSIQYGFSGPAAAFDNIIPNGFDFENLNPGSPITSVSLSTDIAGLGPGRVTFSSSSVQIDMHASNFQARPTPLRSAWALLRCPNPGAPSPSVPDCLQ